MKKLIAAVVVAVMLIGGVMAVQASEQKASDVVPQFDPGGGRT